MKVKIVNVDIENVVKGKSRYSKATVAYLYNGEARTQSVMSFTNPAVFKAVQDSVGQEVEVEVTKNDAGYNQWVSVGGVGNEAPAAQSTGSPTPTTAPTRVTGSNYETPAERAARQVYIVKQSSISSAIALAEANKAKSTPEDIISTAQVFVDWVFDNYKDTSMESLKSDVL